MTQEKSVLAWIDRDSFRQLMENYPQISQNLLRVLTRRVRLSTEQIMALGTLDVLGKVARQLIVFADQYGQKNELGIVIPLRLTQSEIAGLVGCSRERVNQVFLSLRTQKLISVDNAFRITVRDIEQLRKVLSNR
ncbi:MAG: Crp/Fnr family transcriptional regulator, partial [Chthonomonadales bacterium]